MADKRIADLPEVQQINSTDTFLLEQSGEAKQLTGAVFIDFVAEASKRQIQAYIDSYVASKIDDVIDEEIDAVDGGTL